MGGFFSHGLVWCIRKGGLRGCAGGRHVLEHMRFWIVE